MTPDEIVTILGQAIGIIATVLTLISYQANTKKGVMLFLGLATTCTTVSYLLLGGTSGFYLNVVCLTRNVFYYFQKEKTLGIYISTAVFMTSMAILGVFSWQGPISLLITVALIINTFIMSLGDPQKLRYSIFLTSTLVLIYNVYVFTIGGIMNEAISIISSLIGVLRFRKASASKKQIEATVPEVKEVTVEEETE